MAIATQQIIDLMNRYESTIRNSCPGGVALIRHDNPGHDFRKSMEHSLFMALEIRAMCLRLGELMKPSTNLNDMHENVRQYHPFREKIMRWLGWLQSSLNHFGIYTLEELKMHNAPSGTVFQKDGGATSLATAGFADGRPDQAVVVTYANSIEADPALQMRVSHIKTLLENVSSSNRDLVLAAIHDWRLVQEPGHIPAETVDADSLVNSAKLILATKRQPDYGWELVSFQECSKRLARRILDLYQPQAQKDDEEQRWAEALATAHGV